MVKAADLGYPITNIGDVPKKKRRKKEEEELEEAIQNLASSEFPSKLSLTHLPDYLRPVLKGE